MSTRSTPALFLGSPFGTRPPKPPFGGERGGGPCLSRGFPDSGSRPGQRPERTVPNERLEKKPPTEPTAKKIRNKSSKAKRSPRCDIGYARVISPAFSEGRRASNK